eukprot:1661686-Amphidinium_carterae.1
MCEVATPSTLDRYAAEFAERAAKYPSAWHLACRAEARCRTEWWPSERRKQEAFHQSSPSLSAFLPSMPWES